MTIKRNQNDPSSELIDCYIKGVLYAGFLYYHGNGHSNGLPGF